MDYSAIDFINLRHCDTWKQLKHYFDDNLWLDSSPSEMATNEFHVKATTTSPSGCLGNKPHKCDIFDRRSVSQSGLEDHVRTHYEYYSALLDPMIKTESNALDAKC